MRQITTHLKDPNELRTVVAEAWDDPTPEGVHRKYRLGINVNREYMQIATLVFQSKPSLANPTPIVDGLNEEVLLAVVVDRLKTTHRNDRVLAPLELLLDELVGKAPPEVAVEPPEDDLRPEYDLKQLKPIPPAKKGKGKKK